MANLKAKDADSSEKYLKSLGEGTEQEPFIIEHYDSAVFNKLIAIADKLDRVKAYFNELLFGGVYKRILAADDLIITNYYLDEATPDRRIDRIEYGSLSTYANAVETYTYGGSSGNYYVVSVSRIAYEESG